MVNPVDLITTSRRRIARLAAMETALHAVLPIAVTVAAAATIEAIGALGWERWGYALEPARVAILRDAAIALAVAELLALGYFARRAWRAGSDFVAAAARIDDLVTGQQEVVTLATLADPAKPVTLADRSPLFPVLWRRVIDYLEQFDPRRRFRLELAQPIARSSVLALAVVVALGLAAIAMVRPATPVQVLSHSLRQFASSLASSPVDSDRQLAEAARDVANDLENPKLPPEQKQAELQALKQQIDQSEKQKRNGAGSGNSGGNNGSGQGSGSGKGAGQGSGKGSGGSGTGQDQGGSGGKSDKANGQMVELRNDISKAQAQMEMQSGATNKSQVAQQNGEKGAGLAPQQGQNPNQAGAQNKPNANGNLEMPKPGNLAQGQTPSGGNQPSGRKDDKGTSGDTHLGDFPKAANYERFYKLGEKGPPIDLRDARYVVFRMPTAVVAGGGEGKTVADDTRLSASTAYTNVPLKEERLPASPDEEQLVPPRYRDLIR